MPTIFYSTGGFAQAPGALEFLERNGWRIESIFSKAEVKGRISRDMVRQTLLDRAPDLEYLVIGVSPITRAFLERAVNLKHIAMFGVGVEHIDLAAATDRGVLVTNAPGANARSVAELTLGLMLSLARFIPAMHQSVCAGQWKRRQGRDLRGKTLGIVGLGHIGREVAHLAGCLGMKVLGSTRHPSPEREKELGFPLLPLRELLPQVDFLTLHLPGGAEAPLIGASELALMRESACLINTARGSLVDLDALHLALKDGKLAGAGLDVFPQEPVDASHPIFQLPNLVATPHAGALTLDTQEAVSLICLEEAARAKAKERSPRACNPEVYARWGV